MKETNSTADAVAAERERCAKVVHEYFYNPDRLDTVTAAGLCAAIRATGTPEPPVEPAWKAAMNQFMKANMRYRCAMEKIISLQHREDREVSKEMVAIAKESIEPPAPAPSPEQEDVARVEYPHLSHCNGDRRFPAGMPGHSCSCMNLKWVDALVEAAERKGALAEAEWWEHLAPDCAKESGESCMYCERIAALREGAK